MKTDFAKQQKFLFWIIGIGLLVLLLANALGWLYLQRIKTFFISDLKFRLENITNLSSELIDPTDISYIFPGDKSNPQSVYYQNRLFQIKENNNLQDIYILSPTLEILVDINPDYPSSELSARSPDKDLIREALNGETTTGDLQTLGDHKFLTAIARTRDLSLQLVNLRDMMTKLQLGFSEQTDIEFKFEFSDDCPIINTDRNALEQILLNIIKNGVQSCSQDGKIGIRCEPGPKNQINIYITDNGPGIPNEIIDRIFDPFFTTRDKGSGLGLAISKRLLEQLNGEISVKSIPEEGTTVTISLPN